LVIIFEGNEGSDSFVETTCLEQLTGSHEKAVKNSFIQNSKCLATKLQ